MKKARMILLISLSGLIWFGRGLAEEPRGSVAPEYTLIGVEGDESQFREHFWTREGSIGGLERFNLKDDLDKKTSFEGRGHALFGNDDYEIELKLSRKDTGFLRGGFSEYSKYFDDSGGFFEPFAESSFDLNRDLELNIGKFFLEAGVTLPDWPKLRLAYEHRYKDGEKSLTGWGAVTQSGMSRNIFPTFKDVDETRDILTGEIDHTVHKVKLQDRFRYEHFESDTTRHEESRDLDAGESESVTVDESQSSDNFLNTFSSEMNISESVYASLGYFYSQYEGDADFGMLTLPFNEPFDKNWSASMIDLDQKSHLLNLNLMAGPYKDVRLSGGIGSEWVTTKGDTKGQLRGIGFGGNLEEPAVDAETDRDGRELEENLGIRYTGLPKSTLYAEGRWIQEDIDLQELEREDQSVALDRSTDTDRTEARYKTGFSTSPIRQVTLAAHYKREQKNNDYDHATDSVPAGYSAFILEQDISTDELGAKLSLQPKSWIRTSFAYRLVETTIDTVFDNDPSKVSSGDYDAHIYTLDVTFTPVSNLFLSLVQSYWDIQGDSYDQSVDAVIPYEGDVFTSFASASYALDEKTELWLDYTYSRTNNFKDNADSGLPLLLDDRLQRVRTGLSRQLSDRLEMEVSYHLYEYAGEHNKGINDYSAHLVGVKISLDF